MLSFLTVCSGTIDSMISFCCILIIFLIIIIIGHPLDSTTLDGTSLVGMLHLLSIPTPDTWWMQSFVKLNYNSDYYSEHALRELGPESQGINILNRETRYMQCNSVYDPSSSECHISSSYASFIFYFYVDLFCWHCLFFSSLALFPTQSEQSCNPLKKKKESKFHATLFMLSITMLWRGSPSSTSCCSHEYLCIAFQQNKVHKVLYIAKEKLGLMAFFKAAEKAPA